MNNRSKSKLICLIHKQKIFRFSRCVIKIGIQIRIFYIVFHSYYRFTTVPFTASVRVLASSGLNFRQNNFFSLFSFKSSVAESEPVEPKLF